jgi:PAS domain S-box-containing protein
MLDPAQEPHPAMEAFPPIHAIELDGHFIFLTREFAAALGHDLSALIGRPVIDFVHPDERSMVRERAEHLIRSSEPRPAAAQRMSRADWTYMNVEVSAVAVEIAGRSSVLAILHGIAQRREVTAHMMQMDRMMSVGLVAAGLGHEINNPLSVVAANVDLALRAMIGLESSVTELLSDRADADDHAALVRLKTDLSEVREGLADARRGARRVQSIVRDLRAFSRPELDPSEPVQIEGVLQAAVALVRNEIRHRAQLVKTFERVPAVVGNEARLGQVFLNLLINAVHAIPVGDANRHQIRLAICAAPGAVVVEISDTGAGIAETDLPRIFEPFFTTKPTGEGTGLGLAICRNIVLSQGGTIDVESELGRGTTFRVSLPAAAIRAPPRTESAAAPLSAPVRRLRVLVVDDEPLIGRVVQRCLGREHDVRWVSGGREALELLFDDAARFDVVFLDVMMPEMTGIEVCEAIAKQKPELLRRVVFLTGGAFTPEASEFLARIPNHQLAKPFEPRELRNTAEEVAARAGDS